MQLREVEVLGYAPWVGPSGVEGAIVRSTNGEALLLVGPVVAEMLNGANAPNRKRVPFRRRNDGSIPGEARCTDCGRMFASRQALSVHRRNSHPDVVDLEPCSKCGKVFAPGTAMAQHLSRAHGVLSQSRSAVATRAARKRREKARKAKNKRGTARNKSR